MKLKLALIIGFLVLLALGVGLFIGFNDGTPLKLKYNSCEINDTRLVIDRVSYGAIGEGTCTFLCDNREVLVACGKEPNGLHFTWEEAKRDHPGCKIIDFQCEYAEDTYNNYLETGVIK